MIILSEHLHYAPLDGLRRLARSLGVHGWRRSRGHLVRRVLAALAREQAIYGGVPRATGGWSW